MKEPLHAFTMNKDLRSASQLSSLMSLPFEPTIMHGQLPITQSEAGPHRRGHITNLEDDMEGQVRYHGGEISLSFPFAPDPPNQRNLLFISIPYSMG